MIKITRYMAPDNSLFYGGGSSPEYLSITNFPCGESNIAVSQSSPESGDLLEIDFSYSGDGDIIQLLLTVDALKRTGHKASDITLNIGYMPYGRQDRVCNPGEPHSLKVICQLINSMELGKVVVEDPHSDVIEALLDNVEVLTISDIFSYSHEFMYSINLEFDRVVSPDAGAYKKVSKVARDWNRVVIRADKVRGTKTGAISDIEVYADDLTGQRVMIVDDICDGGGTFIGLAKKLKEKGAETVLLYTTHGMYTKGVAVLLENGVDKVICKNYHGPSEDRSQVTILD